MVQQGPDTTLFVIGTINEPGVESPDNTVGSANHKMLGLYVPW